MWSQWGYSVSTLISFHKWSSQNSLLRAEKKFSLDSELFTTPLSKIWFVTHLQQYEHGRGYFYKLVGWTDSGHEHAVLIKSVVQCINSLRRFSDKISFHVCPVGSICVSRLFLFLEDMSALWKQKGLFIFDGLIDIIPKFLKLLLGSLCRILKDSDWVAITRLVCKIITKFSYPVLFARYWLK